jgi:hypothetical protein
MAIDNDSPLQSFFPEEYEDDGEIYEAEGTMSDEDELYWIPEAERRPDDVAMVAAAKQTRDALNLRPVNFEKS